MIDLYEPCMSEKGLKMQFRSPGPVRISADAALLHRVIVNLLDNELKHLPAPCAVSVSLVTRSDFATLTVEDDGPGFAAEIGSRIFEERVKSRESSGYGLGLAFVQAVVKAHGGTVTATNRAVGGAQLTLTWPTEGRESVERDRHLTFA